MSDGELRIIDQDELATSIAQVENAIGPHFACMVIVWPRKEMVAAAEIAIVSELTVEDAKKLFNLLLKNVANQQELKKRQ